MGEQNKKIPEIEDKLVEDIEDIEKEHSALQKIKAWFNEIPEDVEDDIDLAHKKAKSPLDANNENETHTEKILSAAKITQETLKKNIAESQASLKRNIAELNFKAFQQSLEKQKEILKGVWILIACQTAFLFLCIGIIIAYSVFSLSCFQTLNSQIVTELLSFLKFFTGATLTEFIAILFFITKRIYTDTFTEDSIAISKSMDNMEKSLDGKDNATNELQQKEKEEK